MVACSWCCCVCAFVFLLSCRSLSMAMLHIKVSFKSFVYNAVASHRYYEFCVKRIKLKMLFRVIGWNLEKKNKYSHCDNNNQMNRKKGEKNRKRKTTQHLRHKWNNMYTQKPKWLFHTRFDVSEQCIRTSPIVLTDQLLNATANDLILRFTLNTKYLHFNLCDTTADVHTRKNMKATRKKSAHHLLLASTITSPNRKCHSTRISFNLFASRKFTTCTIRKQR